MVKFRKSDRTEAISLSEIVQISESASKMKAQGHDILALSTGEPDFQTPTHICDAAVEAMQLGQTRYTPTAGTLALRKAITDDATFEATPENVIVSTGAKQVLANIFLATLNDGDEVIMPTPYWTSYSDIVTVAGGVPVLVCCGPDQGFKMTPEQLDAAITPKTRWLLINSPSNPTGAMYTHDELQALAGVLVNHPHVWIASDEIYQHLSYVPFTSFRQAAPELAERTIIVNGVSKAHSMTGWRIGWGIGPVDLIKAMITVQGQITSGACSIAQAAAVAALSGPKDHIAERLAIFLSRREMIVQALNAIPGISCPVPDGAFYVFPSCAGLIGSRTPVGVVIENDADFCAFVLAIAGLAIVPGRAFGQPNHFRLSFAYSDADLKDGCSRIKNAVSRLSLPH
ncbi:MAG: aspartate aminotransferase [Gammaproteobacteria bacterium]|jgi:aspartate aminotransferase